MQGHTMPASAFFSRRIEDGVLHIFWRSWLYSDSQVSKRHKMIGILVKKVSVPESMSISYYL